MAAKEAVFQFTERSPLTQEIDLHINDGFETMKCVRIQESILVQFRDSMNTTTNHASNRYSQNIYLLSLEQVKRIGSKPIQIMEVLPDAEGYQHPFIKTGQTWVSLPTFLGLTNVKKIVPKNDGVVDLRPTQFKIPLVRVGPVQESDRYIYRMGDYWSLQFSHPRWVGKNQKRQVSLICHKDKEVIRKCRDWAFPIVFNNSQNVVDVGVLKNRLRQFVKAGCLPPDEHPNEIIAATQGDKPKKLDFEPYKPKDIGLDFIQKFPEVLKDLNAAALRLHEPQFNDAHREYLWESLNEKAQAACIQNMVDNNHPWRPYGYIGPDPAPTPKPEPTPTPFTAVKRDRFFMAGYKCEACGEIQRRIHKEGELSDIDSINHECSCGGQQILFKKEGCALVKETDDKGYPIPGGYVGPWR